jgi:hypothetical protein
MAPLGSPVVPEVKAIRQTSSAAVSAGAKRSAAAAMRASSPSGASLWKGTTRVRAGRCGAGGFEFGEEAGVAESERGGGLVERIDQLAGAQHGHGGDGDAAGLDDGEHAGGHHRRVGAADQDGLAGDEAERAGEDVGDTVDALGGLGVGPGGGGAEDAGGVGRAVAGAVEQFGDRVEAGGVLQVGEGEDQVGPGGAGRDARRTLAADASAARVRSCAVPLL